MNGSPLYRAHARLASPGEHETEAFTKLTVESGVTAVCELSTDLGGSQTSTQVRLCSRGFVMRLSCAADLIQVSSLSFTIQLHS